MSAFQLDNYELANDTIKRFWAEYPVGRIVPVIVDIDLAVGWVMFKVDIYREYADLEPSATGHAYGNVAFYPANMKKWFIEDTETSAIARAIKLLTPSAERPSREDMMKVETLPPVPDAQDFWAANSKVEKIDLPHLPMLGQTIAEVSEALLGVATQSTDHTATQATPRCTHGARVWKTGNKNNKAWAGYMCQEINRNNQCAPVWYELDAAGKWGVRQ